MPKPTDIPAVEAAVEALDKELALFLYHGPFGPAIQHPLCQTPMYEPSMAASLNSQVRHKRDMLKASLRSGDFHQYVFLHERPFRAEAFSSIDELLTDGDYWRLLRHVWIDSENIRENAAEWEQLLRADRPDKESLMESDERKLLAALPELVQVYQGHTDQRDDGWSWTLDRGVAVWFARRFALLEKAEPALSTCHVNRDDIVAYFGSRGEQEVLIPPEAVRQRTVEPVAPDKTR